MFLRSGRVVGKLASLPEVRLWVDGSEAFPRLIKLIRRARHTIIVQMFIWKDDATGRRIASALVEAADRGVTVDITKEAVGDLFEVQGDFLGTQQSMHACWKRFWNHPRIRVTHSTNRDHAKVYIIDDQTLLLTGMNIADEYRYEYHDYMVELRGKRFVEHYLTGRPPASDDASVQLVMNTETEARIRPALLSILDQARRSVVVEHCYFSDETVVDHLLQLVRRGVRVTVIIPERSESHHYANMTAIGRLLSAGKGLPLRIVSYPAMMHAKIILVDRRTAFVGSANLNRYSLDDMGEVNVIIRGKFRSLWKLRESLRRDVLRSRPLNSKPSLLWLTRWLAWLGL